MCQRVVPKAQVIHCRAWYLTYHKEISSWIKIASTDFSMTLELDSEKKTILKVSWKTINIIARTKFDRVITKSTAKSYCILLTIFPDASVLKSISIKRKNQYNRKIIKYTFKVFRFLMLFYKFPYILQEFMAADAVRWCV